MLEPLRPWRARAPLLLAALLLLLLLCASFDTSDPPSLLSASNSLPDSAALVQKAQTAAILRLQQRKAVTEEAAQRAFESFRDEYRASVAADTRASSARDQLAAVQRREEISKGRAQRAGEDASKMEARALKLRERAEALRAQADAEEGKFKLAEAPVLDLSLKIKNRKAALLAATLRVADAETRLAGIKKGRKAEVKKIKALAKVQAHARARMAEAEAAYDAASARAAAAKLPTDFDQMREEATALELKAGDLTKRSEAERKTAQAFAAEAQRFGDKVVDARARLEEAAGTARAQGRVAAELKSASERDEDDATALQARIDSVGAGGEGADGAARDGRGGSNVDAAEGAVTHLPVNRAFGRGSLSSCGLM